MLLHFEEVDKPNPPYKLEHSIKKVLQRSVQSSVHKKISENEQDNVGLEAVHGTKKAGEFTSHSLQNDYHSHKLKPYRTLEQAEKKSIKADMNVLYKKNLRDNPKAASHLISRFQQKRAIKAANDDYTELEMALQNQNNNIEQDYPNYDEYRYDLDSIGHDPCFNTSRQVRFNVNV